MELQRARWRGRPEVKLIRPEETDWKAWLIRSRIVRLNRWLEGLAAYSERTVAVKILPRDISADPERRARFEREAKTIAGLAHSHICTFHDIGEHAGSMFLVMDHLNGETLAHRLEKGSLPIEQAFTIATDIADALSEAHHQGIIHRDLKPANIMLTTSGVKLLDFGLAKLQSPTGVNRPSTAETVNAEPSTAKGTILGTLHYMSPEQLEGTMPLRSPMSGRSAACCTRC